MKTFRDRPAFLVNAGTPAHEKTVVVLGAFRGGTSMVAHVLKALGVFMGETFRHQAEYDNHEDQEFVDLLHVPKIVDPKIVAGTMFSEADFRIPAGIRALIERRNAAHSLWGWKYPGTILWLLHSPLARHLRNPHFVTVFRDPLAIGQHELDVGRMKPEALRAPRQLSFRWLSRQVQWLSDHVMCCEYPHLLVSFERLRWSSAGAKGAFVDDLIRFLGPAIAQPCREAAIEALIKPERQDTVGGR